MFNVEAFGALNHKEVFVVREHGTSSMEFGNVESHSLCSRWSGCDLGEEITRQNEFTKEEERGECQWEREQNTTGNSSEKGLTRQRRVLQGGEPVTSRVQKERERRQNSRSLLAEPKRVGKRAGSI